MLKNCRFVLKSSKRSSCPKNLSGFYERIKFWIFFRIWSGTTTWQFSGIKNQKIIGMLWRHDFSQWKIAIKARFSLAFSAVALCFSSLLPPLDCFGVQTNSHFILLDPHLTDETGFVPARYGLFVFLRILSVCPDSQFISLVAPLSAEILINSVVGCYPRPVGLCFFLGFAGMKAQKVPGKGMIHRFPIVLQHYCCIQKPT